MFNGREEGCLRAGDKINTETHGSEMCWVRETDMT